MPELCKLSLSLALLEWHCALYHADSNGPTSVYRIGYALNDNVYTSLPVWGYRFPAVDYRSTGHVRLSAKKRMHKLAFRCARSGAVMLHCMTSEIGPELGLDDQARRVKAATSHNDPRGL